MTDAPTPEQTLATLLPLKFPEHFRRHRLHDQQLLQYRMPLDHGACDWVTYAHVGRAVHAHQFAGLVVPLLRVALERQDALWIAAEGVGRVTLAADWLDAPVTCPPELLGFRLAFLLTEHAVTP